MSNIVEVLTKLGWESRDGVHWGNERFDDGAPNYNLLEALDLEQNNYEHVLEVVKIVMPH